MTTTLRHERIAQYRKGIERERPNLRSEHPTERFIAGRLIAYYEAQIRELEREYRWERKETA